MIIKNPELEQVCGFKSQYPTDSLKEIALLGRSNVGKSSFINTILNRKNLARTSQKPGKTRTVNFYNIDNVFRLVDLPGYGYAKVSKTEKKKWANLITEYLNTRQNLAEVFLVVDLRHPPTKEDIFMYNWIIESSFTGFVIATKFDKIPKTHLKRHIKEIKNALQIEDEDLIFAFSAKTKHNKDVIIEQIDAIINERPE